MLEGLVWGVLFYSIASIIALFAYNLYSPLYQRSCFVILFCGVGHYVGTLMYPLVPQDSFVQFFQGASPNFNWVNSTQIVKCITWHVREYLTGDSYLATLYFFSAFSFVGSVLWYLLYLQLAQALNISNQKYIFPALVIMCWPSFLFFTCGIVKDSWCYFLIPLVFLSWNQFHYERKNRVMMLFLIFLSLFVMILTRSYLLMVFAGAYYLSKFEGFKKLTLLNVVSILIILPIFIYVVYWVNGSETTLDSVSNRAVFQQTHQNKGSSFPMLTKDPKFVLFALPYNFIMNLIMPMFIFARNIVGYTASLENVFLVYLIYRFWKKRRVYKLIKNQLKPVKLYMSFFIVGMSFMSLINTNLGLAMRQKSMYMPCLLVIMMLVWQYGKQKKVPVEMNRDSLKTQENQTGFLAT